MGRLGLWFVALFAALLAYAAPVAAADPAPDLRCGAAVAETGAIAETLARPIVWRCPGKWAGGSKARQLARFTFDPANPPRLLVSRIAKFDRMIVAWRAADGSIASIERPFETLHAAFLDRRFALDLPALPQGADTLWVAIDHTTQPLPLDYLVLARTPPGTSESDRNTLMLAALILGLLLMPLLFDFAFYRVLREPFILWHMAFVACMAAQLTLTEGLYLPLFDPDLQVTRALTVGSFGLVVATAAMFLATFVERGIMGPWASRGLRIAAIWMLAVTLLHAPGFDSLGTLPAKMFYFSGLPIGIIVVAAGWDAWRGGSRMVRYVAIGFSPLVVVALIRVLSFALPGVPTAEATGLFIAGMIMEVSTTALGVAARFLALRDERDLARSEVRDLETLAGRDPLTGLLNRRAVEPRFAELRRSGYETFALIDLDHFKQVNDRHGHAVGDAVLVATAEVFSSEPECVAIRLGGEEFLLLLHGPGADKRAERVRAAITARVARQVEGLFAPVTASMGVIVAPHAALPRAKFNDLYVMADKLLYEAKSAGRNRTFSEKVRAFREPRRERRRAA